MFSGAISMNYPKPTAGGMGGGGFGSFGSAPASSQAGGMFGAAPAMGMGGLGFGKSRSKCKIDFFIMELYRSIEKSH